MSTMDLKELRQLSSDELAEKAKQLAQELFNLRSNWAPVGSRIPCRFERPSGRSHK